MTAETERNISADELEQALASKVSKYSNILTRSNAFKKLTKWAFDICDADGTGKVNKDELYAGILMVHLKLAKSAGPAACYPPTRETIEELFDAADHDKSGDIDEHEFGKIMVICCGQIFSRMVVYYGLIVFFVPYLAGGIVLALTNFNEWLGLPSRSSSSSGGAFALVENVITFGKLTEKVVSFSLFSLVVPGMFDFIDSVSKKSAAEKSFRHKKED